MSGQQHAPAALYPRQRPGTHFTGAWVGQRAGLDGRKNLVPTGIRSRTFQPVVSRYTDWATRPTIIRMLVSFKQVGILVTYPVLNSDLTLVNLILVFRRIFLCSSANNTIISHIVQLPLSKILTASHRWRFRTAAVGRKWQFPLRQAVTSQETSMLSHIVLQLSLPKHITVLKYAAEIHSTASVSTKSTVIYKKIWILNDSIYAFIRIVLVFNYLLRPQIEV